MHCKTCDIKDPSQNITWVTPEGFGGPTTPTCDGARYPEKPRAMTQHAVGFVCHIDESIPSGSGARAESRVELDASGARGFLLKLERVVRRDGERPPALSEAADPDPSRASQGQYP